MTTDSTEMPAAETAELRPSARMMQMLGGFQIAQALYVIAKLDIATMLDDGPETCEELARRAGAHPDALWRLIRTLASVGVFSTEGGLIANTELGAVLSRRHPESAHAAAHFWMETHYRPFAELLRTARTGQSAATYALGEDFLQWIAADPDRSGLLSRSMAEATTGVRGGMFNGYDLPAGEVVADIGGADGAVLVSLLADQPDRKGIVFDQPGVAPLANARIEDAGLADRVVSSGGDFFDSVPVADVYILAYVLHDWDDASARRILDSVAAAAGPGSRLLVIEGLMPDGDGPHFTKLLDLTMLAMTTGRERTAAEFGELLVAAGFVVDRIVATSSAVSIIEATRTIEKSD